MTFLYILIGIIIGWFIGFLDSNRNMQKKLRAVEFNAEIKIEEAEKRAALAEKGGTAAPSVQDDPDLLRLKRQDGRYLLELDGVPAPAELNMDMRKRLVELITVFRLWLGPVQPVVSATPPETDSVRELVSPPAPTLVQQTPIKPVAAQAKKPEPEKSIASLSIVQQIDTVLQERLLSSPLAGRGIRLQESIQGGVEVYVGLKKFDAVDDVPDQEIKAAIRSAIAEWEKKYTPGI